VYVDYATATYSTTLGKSPLVLTKVQLEIVSINQSCYIPFERIQMQQVMNRECSRTCGIVGFLGTRAPSSQLHGETNNKPVMRNKLW
jgi:hypothetical protein